MGQTLLKTLGLIFFAGFSTLALAQDPDSFQLFEEVERPDSTSQEQRVRRVETQRPGSNEPMFTLVGTTRIGSDQSALLLHQSGSVIRVEIEPESNTRIPGYRDYSIVYFGPRQVSIRYPDTNLCQEFTDKGVSCSLESNIAALSLVNREPLPPSRPSTPANNGEPQPGSAVEQGTENEEIAQQTNDSQPVNPFAALINARNNNAADNADSPSPANSQRFEVQRINPADVPEGMRIVSTPFGDRLVPR